MASPLGSNMKGPFPVAEGSSRDRPPAGGEFEEGHKPKVLFLQPTAVVLRPARVQPIKLLVVLTTTATPSMATLETEVSTAPPSSVATLLEVNEAMEMAPSQ